MSEEQEAEVADEETEEAEDEANDGLQSGDFVRLDYTARTVEDGNIVDTTDPEVAEEEGLDEEGREFEPRVIVLGQGHIFQSVEDDIIGGEVGDSDTVTIPAEEAFGEYNQEEVRTVSADKLPEDERYPGAHVNVDGEHGHVETIIGGRARVDFNHPLAGEDIEYDYEVEGVVEDPEEQAKGLISMYLDADLEMWIQTDEVEEETVVESDEDDEDGEPETETETVEKETLYIESTPQLAMNQQWMFQKQQIAQQVMDQLDLDRVIVQETIEGGGMPGMGGMMGGMGGGDVDLEEALEDADIDEDEIVEELEAEGEGEDAEETEE
ncbi:MULTISPECIES: FKBP-type peptidyl-prolyl cis-trans isomerase [Halorussus]|uniref:FKBP-type peptidyl-prolyl cis-trans isomerase n=1 Tax=Halorussus TaxID=1070314 RepID=UPI0020A005AD|nr:peptidylprolyl isomerase [Halorussus vallis]USZ76368.1 peptidylprolyl isomerase [Halorussus vallis]